jgi:hypothetical protein
MEEPRPERPSEDASCLFFTDRERTHFGVARTSRSAVRYSGICSAVPTCTVQGKFAGTCSVLCSVLFTFEVAPWQRGTIEATPIEMDSREHYIPSSPLETRACPSEALHKCEDVVDRGTGSARSGLDGQTGAGSHYKSGLPLTTTPGQLSHKFCSSSPFLSPLPRRLQRHLFDSEPTCAETSSCAAMSLDTQANLEYVPLQTTNISVFKKLREIGRGKISSFIVNTVLRTPPPFDFR